MSGVAIHPVQRDGKLFFYYKFLSSHQMYQKQLTAGADVSLEYVRPLHGEDMMQDIKLAAKLNNKVLNPTNIEKQCVRSAVSLFSPSVTTCRPTWLLNLNSLVVLERQFPS